MHASSVWGQKCPESFTDVKMRGVPVDFGTACSGSPKGIIETVYNHI